MKKKPTYTTLNISEKANRILNGILIVLILIAIRIWHLAVIKHEEKLEEAAKPQKRVVIEKTERATIYDRFHIPLATNHISYAAYISYAPIRLIPRSIWEKEGNKKKKKKFLRKEYISQLSLKLASELTLDAERIEDLIYSKAALLGNVPCLIKENITEQEFYRLSMLEKDWPGLKVEMKARRSYPLGPVGSHVIGYIGPISSAEYNGITEELSELRECIAAYDEGEEVHFPYNLSTIEEVEKRLEELEGRAYCLNDLIGKTGVEASFDATLRGRRGKRIYLADTRGNYLQELPGFESPLPGSRLILTLSAELQTYAENLLNEYEVMSFAHRPNVKKKLALLPEHRPWIKGGAIVALNPKTGELYALASTPRFNPNDFIRNEADQKSTVHKWLETESYLADVWNLKTPFSKEILSTSIEKLPLAYSIPQEEMYKEKSIEMNWNNFLGSILPKNSVLRQVIEKKNTLADALFVQQTLLTLFFFFHDEAISLTPSKIINFVYARDDNIPIKEKLTLDEKDFLEHRSALFKDEIFSLQKNLSPYFSSLPLNYEKLLLADLYRIAFCDDAFSPKLIELFEALTINDHRETEGIFATIHDVVSQLIKGQFHDVDFKLWRQQFFADYLNQRREEEKISGTKYQRPYIEYLDRAEKELFNSFWESHKWDLITFFLLGYAEKEEPELFPYFNILEKWSHELQKGAHAGLPWTPHFHKLKEILSSFDSSILYDYLKTLRRFETLERPVWGRYYGLRGNCEKHLAASFYPLYGYGYTRSFAFRTAGIIGSLFKLVPGYEALRQRYLLFEGGTIPPFQLNPLSIIDDKHKVWGKEDTWNVGFHLDGRPIPMYYRGGRIPRSEHAGIGKVDFTTALAASSNPYFALLAGDIIDDPEDLCQAAHLLGYGQKTGLDLPGEYSGKIPKDVIYDRTGLYALAIGQHSLVGTPLQTALMLATIANGGEMLKPQIVKAFQKKGEIEKFNKEVRWNVFLPPQIQEMLLSGLKQVIHSEKGTARELRYEFSPLFLKQIIGKTSTAESLERMSLDGTCGHLMTKHIGFGAISYETTDFSEPDLIVVVYLCHGDFGRDAAPFALKIIQKWREIQKKHRPISCRSN